MILLNDAIQLRLVNYFKIKFEIPERDAGTYVQFYLSLLSKTIYKWKDSNYCNKVWDNWLNGGTEYTVNLTYDDIASMLLYRVSANNNRFIKKMIDDLLNAGYLKRTKEINRTTYKTKKGKIAKKWENTNNYAVRPKMLMRDIRYREKQTGKKIIYKNEGIKIDNTTYLLEDLKNQNMINRRNK